MKTTNTTSNDHRSATKEEYLIGGHKWTACVIYDHRRVSKKLHEDFVSELYGIHCFRTSSGWISNFYASKKCFFKTTFFFI